MTETEPLASEIRRSVSGETWFGPSLAVVLDGVDARAAACCPDGASHSIGEIVAHVAVWARYATYRFEGGAPRELDEDDWPSAAIPDEQSWELVRADALASCESAAQAVAGLAAEALDAVSDSTPRDELGEPVTLRRIASGLAQHVAYHSGQIAVLKRLSGSRRSPL